MCDEGKMKTVLKESFCRFMSRSSWIVGSLLMLGLGIGQAFADSTAVPAGSLPVSAGAPQQPGGLMSFVPILLMFLVLYFLILRPQQKKMKEQQDMLTALKQGDEVVTASGILGKITGINDKVVTLEIAENVRVKFLKSQIAQVVKDPIKDLKT